jgi:hypothetical protein
MPFRISLSIREGPQRRLVAIIESGRRHDDGRSEKILDLQRIPLARPIPIALDTPDHVAGSVIPSKLNATEHPGRRQRV